MVIAPGTYRGFKTVLLLGGLCFAVVILPNKALAQDDEPPMDDDLGDYEEPPLPPDDSFNEPPPMDEPPMDEPPMDEPMYEPPPEDPPPMDDPPEPVEQEPPSGDDPSTAPRPDPNYGREDGDSSMVPVDPETQKNRKVIRTVPRKQYSATEIAKYCRQHEGKMISYYSEIYKVEDCKRRRVADNKAIYGLMRDGVTITTVSQDVIAALGEGAPIDREINQKTIRSCKALDGQYITFSNVDVYFVEACQKRLLPDWETYLSHRKKSDHSQSTQITSLSWEEFSALKEGKIIASVIDAAYETLLDGSAGVDVIPVDEACSGVNGKIASYYSRLYRIEKCMKREIMDPASYFKQDTRQADVLEMSSEQWLSLPNGKPINNDRNLTNPKAG